MNRLLHLAVAIGYFLLDLAAAALAVLSGACLWHANGFNNDGGFAVILAIAAISLWILSSIGQDRFPFQAHPAIPEWLRPWVGLFR